MHVRTLYGDHKATIDKNSNAGKQNGTEIGTKITTFPRGLVVVAGGSGGHVFPAMAVAEQAADEGWRVRWITDERARKYGNGYEYLFDEIVCLPEASWWRSSGPVRQGYRVMQAMRAHDVRAVVGFGGQMTVWPMVWARMMGLQTVIHQSDVVVGQANRLLRWIVHQCYSAVGIPKQPVFKAIGTPVRQAFFTAVQEEDRQRQLKQSLHDAVADPALAASRSTLSVLKVLVLGGSQGARVWASLVPQALALLPYDQQKRWHVVHQVRPEDYDGAVQAYAHLASKVTLAPFFPDMPVQMVQADVVITRAGAGTLAELVAVGKPAFLVPYPYAKGHQQHNADLVAAHKAGWVVRENALSVSVLAKFLEFCIANTDELIYAGNNMRAIFPVNAAQTLVQTLSNC